MVPNYLLNKLSNEEIGVVCYVAQTYLPPGFGLNVDKMLISAYKYKKLAVCLVNQIPNIKEEFQDYYLSILEKLNIIAKKENEQEIGKQFAEFTESPSKSAKSDVGTGEAAGSGI